jgi:hypothetical protein
MTAVGRGVRGLDPLLACLAIVLVPVIGGCGSYTEVAGALELSTVDHLLLDEAVVDSGEEEISLEVGVIHGDVVYGTTCPLVFTDEGQYAMERTLRIEFDVPPEALDREVQFEEFTVRFQLQDLDGGSVKNEIEHPGGQNQAELWNGWLMDLAWETTTVQVYMH